MDNYGGKIRVKVRKDKAIMYTKKPGDWSFNDCKGILHDEYKWPTIEDMSDEELKQTIKRVKEKVVQSKDTKTPIHNMTEKEIFDMVKKKMKVRNSKE